MGLGFAWTIALFGVLILVPLGLWRLGLNATVAFWASYVLTRPLGDSMAAWLGKAPAAGGVGWGDSTVTGLGPALFGALVAYLTLTHGDIDGAHAANRHAAPPTDAHPGPPPRELDPAPD